MPYSSRWKSYCTSQRLADSNPTEHSLQDTRVRVVHHGAAAAVRSGASGDLDSVRVTYYRAGAMS